MKKEIIDLNDTIKYKHYSFTYRFISSIKNRNTYFVTIINNDNDSVKSLLFETDKKSDIKDKIINHINDEIKKEEKENKKRFKRTKLELFKLQEQNKYKQRFMF